jgi:potassium-transporting ATPase KdpC subunit
MMRQYLLTALRMCLVSIFLVGIAYPLAVTGLAQLFFPAQANGSLIREGDTVRGSALLGQAFTRPAYFHPRPSAAGTGYDPGASGGSNLGPTSAALTARVATDTARVFAENPGLNAAPVDMVTASASGLDPDISPENALAQAPRVAAARGITTATVAELVRAHTAGRQLGFLGEPRVNVLSLNQALDAMTPGLEHELR